MSKVPPIARPTSAHTGPGALLPFNHTQCLLSECQTTSVPLESFLMLLQFLGLRAAPDTPRGPCPASPPRSQAGLPAPFRCHPLELWSHWVTASPGLMPGQPAAASRVTFFAQISAPLQLPTGSHGCYLHRACVLSGPSARLTPALRSSVGWQRCSGLITGGPI